MMLHTKNATFDLVIICGEPSGDLHGCALIDSLLKNMPQLKIAAVAGPKMRQHPITKLLNMEKLHVFGFLDILFSLPKILRIFFHLKKYLLSSQPKAIVFIDYPDFNIRLEKSLRKHGYKGKLIHYICPTVWAWRKKRISTMTKNLDLLLTIFPFETKYFPSLPTHYCENPILNYIRHYPYQSRFTKDTLAIGIFPGSRNKEIVRNLPLQLKAAKRVLLNYPDASFYLSIANNKEINDLILHLFSQADPLLKKRTIFVRSSLNYDLMKHIDVAMATSGTITLELALHKVPTVVGYAIKPLDLFLARRIFRINLPYYCIVNILANKLVFPELFGPFFTVDNLSHNLFLLIKEKNHIKQVKTHLENIKNLLQQDQIISPAKKIFSILNA